MIILNIYTILSTKKYIFSNKNLPKEKIEYAIILGAGLNKDKTPSRVLQDRLDGGIFLFKQGLIEKIIVSGDHQESGYSETESMEKYLLDEGIPHSAIFRDDFGFSTFETIKNTKNRFKVSSAYFLSQEFHLPRIVKCGRLIGINAYGYKCNFQKYSFRKHMKWRIREVPSRIKDFFLALLYILNEKH